MTTTIGRRATPKTFGPAASARTMALPTPLMLTGIMPGPSPARDASLPLHNLLIYRMLILNIYGFAMVAWAWQQGFIRPIFESDSSRLTYVIVAVFLFGLVGLAMRTVKVSRLINAVKRGERPEVNGAKIEAKNAFLGDIVEALVTLGLLGTFAGIWISFSSIDPGSLTSASAVAEAVPQMLAGIKVAIGTTLVGGFLGLWMFVNNRMLKTATALLTEDAKC